MIILLLSHVSGHLVNHPSMGSAVKKCLSYFPNVLVDAAIQPITRSVVRFFKQVLSPQHCNSLVPFLLSLPSYFIASQSFLFHCISILSYFIASQSFLISLHLNPSYFIPSQSFLISLHLNPFLFHCLSILLISLPLNPSYFIASQSFLISLPLNPFLFHCISLLSYFIASNFYSYRFSSYFI